MNVVIIGSALSGNKGAAAMLESAIQTITGKYSDAKFTLLSLYPEEDEAQNGYDNLVILNATPLRLVLNIIPLVVLYRLLPIRAFRSWLKRRSRAIKSLAEADVFLDQGGITFSDGRELFLIYNVASLLPAFIMGIPILKCAQALGPFRNPINRLVSKLALPRVRLIVARGQYSYENLQTLGLKNIVLGADYAFSLSVQADIKNRLQNKLPLEKLKDGQMVVGVSPSVVLKKQCEKAGIDYVEIIIQFIHELQNKGYLVLLVPHSARENSLKQHNNDLPICRSIYDALEDKENCVFHDGELGSEELRYLIGLCDMFVASRFHAMVSSLSMEVPTLVIGWSHKYAEVLKMFKLEKHAFKYKDLSLRKLESEFVSIEQNREHIKKMIHKYLPDVKRVSNEHVAFVEQIVKTRLNK